MNDSLKSAMDALLTRDFAACMFDYDGTLIERGYRMPLPPYMPELLQNTSRKAYMAICTARPFPAAFKHAHEILGEHFDDLKTKWVWICENGGAGYAYDADSGDFKEFYRIGWPEKTMPYSEFQEIVKKHFHEHVQDIDVHDSVIILRPKNLSLLTVEEIISSCATLEQMGLDLIQHYHLEDEIRLANSSLGVIFHGVDADKDRGIFEFGNYLQKYKNADMFQPFREIICFGDQPVPHGNDEHFLSGRYGTPVNVGEVLIPRENLISVIDEKGERLIGPRATSYLLRQLRFTSL